MITTSATFLRCELGVLPSQLVAERNALYYLWHLRSETWFRHHLPSLLHLSPLSRLVNLLTDYNTTLEEFHQYSDTKKWHSAVKTAVLARAQTWYNVAPHQQRLPSFRFVYRGLPYLRRDLTCHLAPVALQARADRLPGVPNAWLHQLCPFCDCPAGLNGARLLQCPQVPAPLAAARDELRPSLSVPEFAAAVVACEPGDFTKAGLCFAHKLFKAARRAVQGPTPPTSPSSQVPEDAL